MVGKTDLKKKVISCEKNLQEIFFEVTDRIKIFASDNERLAKIIEKILRKLKNITLADEIIFEKVSDAKDWDINGEKISLQVEKI